MNVNDNRVRIESTSNETSNQPPTTPNHHVPLSKIPPAPPPPPGPPVQQMVANVKGHHMSAEIKQKKLERDQRLQNKRIEEVKDKGTFTIDPLGGSHNPVFHLQDDIMLPQEFVQDILTFKGPEETRPIDLQKDCKELYQRMINVYKSQLMALNPHLSPQEIQQIMRIRLPLFGKIYSDIMREAFLKNNSFPSQSAAWQSLSQHFAEECQKRSENPDSSFKSVEELGLYPFLGKFVDYLKKKSDTALLNETSNWENIPKHYSKDEVISRLSLFPDTFELINKLRANPSEFITLTDFEDLDKKRIEAVCTPYVSTLEVLKRMDNEGADNFYKLLGTETSSQTSKTDKKEQLVGREAVKAKPGRVLKYGEEGARELLVEQLNVSLFSNPYLVPKRDSQVGEMQQRGGQTLKKEGGIVGAWVNGTLLSTEGSEMNMRSLSEARKNYEAALHKGDQTEIDSSKKAWENERKKYNSHNVVSVQENARMSLLVMSGDGHMGQYTLEEGSHDVFCFDEGRNLYPSEVFAETVQGNTAHYPFLRAGLLDHPACDEPLDKSLQERILAEDPDEMMERVAHLKGGDFDKELKVYQQYLRAIAFLDHLIANESQIQPQIANLKAIADSLNITLSSPPTKADCQRIQQKIKEITEKTRAEFFSHIHPRAFEGLKQRLVREKEYVEKCIATNTVPTVRGLRDALYPNFAPFLKFLERTEPLSAMFFGFQKNGGVTSRRSLESILEKAKKNNNATPEEIQEMESALLRIKLEAGEPGLLHFCESA